MAVNNLTYNSHGKKYQVPRVRVTLLNDLQKGDHIAFHRHGGAYWHHAIVERIDHDEGEIHVIEYTNTAKGCSADNCFPPNSNCIKAKVIKNTYKFRDENVYLLKHENCLNPDEVVSRAQKKLGDKEYNAITNNCEHCAMSCKTGNLSSDQTNKATEMFINTLPLSAVSAATVVANRALTEGSQEVVKRTVRTIALREVFTQSILNAGQEVAKTTSEQVLTQTAGQEVVKLGIRQVTKEAVAQTVSKAGQEVVKVGIRVTSKEAVAQTFCKAGQEVVKTGIRVTSKEAVAQTFCKAGQEVVKTGIRVASKEAVAQTVSKAGQEVVKTAVHQTTKEVLTQAGSDSGQMVIQSVARKTTEEVLIRTGSEAGQEVVKTGFREVSEEVVTQTVSKPAGGLPGPLVTGALFEGIQIARDLYSAHADMKAGNIDKNELKTVVEKRLMTGAGNVGGSTVGTAIGQVLIPIPFVGAALGAAVGGMAGKFIGNMVANSLL